MEMEESGSLNSDITIKLYQSRQFGTATKKKKKKKKKNRNIDQVQGRNPRDKPTYI